MNLLKTSRKYYDEVQGQIGVTSRKYSDVCIHFRRLYRVSLNVCENFLNLALFGRHYVTLENAKPYYSIIISNLVGRYS